MRRRAFTLVELLVVVLIVLLVSALVLPTILPALAHRQVSEAARILQAALVQARAEAVKASAPRGIRLLPDPTYANSPSILAFNRWVGIEPGPDYANGQVVVWPLWVSAVDGNNYPAPYIAPYPVPGGTAAIYPYLAQADRNAAYPNASSFSPTGQVQMIEQAPFVGNNTAAGLNNPTSWFWNVRIGDRIQVNNTGRSYTVVGPMTVANPELFVNDAAPGTAPSLTRIYTDSAGNQTPGIPVEYLYVVNGQDDDLDGYVDNGFDGYDNNFSGLADDIFEWSEIEQWTGAERGVTGALNTYSNTAGNTPTYLPPPSTYTISRRPVPAPTARETALPSQVVIDATTWSTTRERSRLPIDPNSHTADVLVNPNGQVVLTTVYSSPTSFGAASAFFHFWLSERQDVHEMGDLWGYSGTAPNPNPNAGAGFYLPLPASFYAGLSTAPNVGLVGERALVTLFTRTGQNATNAVEFFNPFDVNTPFYDSQLGAREAR